MGTYEQKAPDMKLQDFKEKFFNQDSSMTEDTQNDAEFEEFMVTHVYPPYKANEMTPSKKQLNDESCKT